MKKLSPLFRLFSLILVVMLLVACTGIDTRSLKATQITTDAAPVDSLDDQNSKPASLAPSSIYLESDAFEELWTRYDAGTVIGFDYSVSALHADECRVTCEGESIMLLSPSRHSIDPTGSYRLEFRAPQKGAGEIVLTFTAIKNGNVSGVEEHAHLYWNSCDLGIFVSTAKPVPELVMAKAQYDANEITSGDYYDIVNGQHFQIDMELMNMLSQVSSDKIEYSGYAAPYVEAVHNSIFGIKSKAAVPPISDTLKKMEDELGIALNTEDTGRSSVQRSALDTMVTINGTVKWIDYAGYEQPATNIRVQIIDIQTYNDLLGTHSIGTILAGDDSTPIYTESSGNNLGSYSVDIPDGASVDDGGYDIVVRILAEGSNVSVSPFTGTTYAFDQGAFLDIAISPPGTINFIAEQQSTSPDYMKAIQVQQAAALASEFAKIMNNGDYLGNAGVVFPALEVASFYFNSLNIGHDHYDLWDVIMHEFGHYVADQLGTFVPLPADHNATSNLWDSEDLSKEYATILAWQEGWANYFAFYAQSHMINNAHYIGAYNTRCGTLGDLYYCNIASDNVENFSYASGEANEGAVMALLWDITDSGPNESFDTLHRDFATIWDCIDNGNCTTLNIFINTLYPAFSASEQAALGNILSEYNISPHLTMPADGAVLSTTTPPTFEWAPGGSPVHPNNDFTLTIYTEESGAVTNVFTSGSQTSLSYTISQNDWNDIIATNGHNTLYWSVSGNQTEEPETGPYRSNSFCFVLPLDTPELIDAVSLNQNTILLLWNEVPGATGYSIYRSDSLNGTYTQISNSFQPYAPIPNAMSYTDTGLTPGHTYYYKIKATGVSESDYSNVMSAIAEYKFTYSLNPDNTLTITGYSGTNLNVVIPSEINGKTVTAIGNDAFVSRELTSVIIPNSITSIGARAFRLTTRLTNLAIPNSVTSIGEAAFQGSSITSIVLPNNLTEISANMFNSSKLTSIIIPDSVTSIGTGVFSNCSDLSDVTLSSNLINIGNGAFSNTTSLTHITLPNSITNIGEYAFVGSNITSINLPNSLTTINAGAFISSKLTSIAMPNSITSIGENAFNGCSDLTSITFSNTLTHIGDNAFYNCRNLDNISIPESIQYIGMFAFRDCTGLSSLNIETSSPDCVIGDHAFNGCTGLTSVTIDTVESVGAWAFSGCNNLVQVDLTNAKNIGMQAFAECSSLEEVNISNADVIGEYSFNVCASLNDVSITNCGVIGSYAFYGCIDLISASIDADEIGDRAFMDCQNLSDLFLADGIEIIADAAFQNCQSLVEVDIPNSVTNLGSMAFLSCTSLTRVLIPGSIQEISPATFAVCSSLYDVTLGEGIVSIMGAAFADCTALNQITIPSSVTYIDETAFQGTGVEL